MFAVAFSKYVADKVLAFLQVVTKTLSYRDLMLKTSLSGTLFPAKKRWLSNKLFSAFQNGESQQSQ